MKTYNNIPDLDSIRILLGKYFDATISPMEMDSLLSAANDVATGKACCHDRKTADELRLIYSISRYAEASLSDFANSLPDGLEDRLSSHISMLAAKSASKKQRTWPKRVILYSGAASVAALLSVGGYHFLNPDNPTKQPSLMIAGASMIADASKIASGDVHSDDHEGSMLLPLPCISTAMVKDGPTTPYAKADTKKRSAKNNKIIKRVTDGGESPAETNSESIPHESSKAFIEEADLALSALPHFTEDAISVSEEALRVMPSGVTAYVETSQLLLQPISTLGQSINCIYESVETLSEALSGVSYAIEAVNNSLALLTNPI